MPNVPGQPSAFPGHGTQGPHRRDSYSGMASAPNQMLSPAVAYVPPPTFSGRQSRTDHAALPRPQPGSASAGPSQPVSAHSMPYPGLPSSTDAHSEPHTGHAHRHSLNGAIPQHGRWQNDQAYHQPPTAAAHGSALASPHHGYEAQPTVSYSTHTYPSMPAAPSRDQAISSSSYTPVAPPSSSFPHLTDMAMALPPLPPPPMVELPGRATPWPPVYGIPTSGSRPTATPMPESYQYAPSSSVPVHPYPPPTAPTVVAHLPSYANVPSQQGATHMATYPLYENRPSSSMGIMSLPERPYSSASAHYPSTVTSSFHISSANATSSASTTGPNAWVGPPQYGTSPEYGGHSESHTHHTQPQNESFAQSRYEPKIDPTYADTSGYNSLAYPPPPRPLSAASPGWTPHDADVKPGRNYLRSLGVGDPSSSIPPAPANMPFSQYPYRPVDQHDPSMPEPNTSWHNPLQAHYVAPYGHQAYESSVPVPPSTDPAQLYQSGQPGAYDQPLHPTYSGY